MLGLHKRRKRPDDRPYDATLLRSDSDLRSDVRRRGALSAVVYRVVLWLALAAAVGVVALRIPDSFSDARRAVAAGRGLTSLERTLLPARSADVSTELFVAADREVPRDATFYIATGDGIDVSSPIVLPKAVTFSAYWLLPRRRTTDPRRADWVLSYGGDLGALGLEYRRVIDVAPGQQLAEVRH